MVELGSDVYEKTENGRDPLIIAAERGDKLLVNFLIKTGINVDSVTSAGKNALYIAVENGHNHIIQDLLDADSNPSQATSRNKIALYAACEQGNLDILNMLLPYSTKEDVFIKLYADLFTGAVRDGFTNESIAKKHGVEKITRTKVKTNIICCSRIDIDITYHNVLHGAAFANDFDAVYFLLRDSMFPQRQTLHQLVQLGHVNNI